MAAKKSNQQLITEARSLLGKKKIGWQLPIVPVHGTRHVPEAPIYSYCEKCHGLLKPTDIHKGTCSGCRGGKTEYVVIGLEGGNRFFRTRQELIRSMAAAGIKESRTKMDDSHLLPMLRGQPRFDKLNGPSMGGSKLVRYETWKVAEMLSR